MLYSTREELDTYAYQLLLPLSLKFHVIVLGIKSERAEEEDGDKT